MSFLPNQITISSDRAGNHTMRVTFPFPLCLPGSTQAFHSYLIPLDSPAVALLRHMLADSLDRLLKDAKPLPAYPHGIPHFLADEMPQEVH